MALARVVSFEGVEADRMAQMSRDVEQGERPEDLPATEMIVLHDPDGAEALAILFFDNDEDYRKGDELLNSMPAEGTPGRRTSVKKYTVAVRASG